MSEFVVVNKHFQCFAKAIGVLFVYILLWWAKCEGSASSARILVALSLGTYRGVILTTRCAGEPIRVDTGTDWLVMSQSEWS